MIFSHQQPLFRALVSLGAMPLLVACENSATSMPVEGKDHALVLVREQPHFWDDTVKQYVVVSRLPVCQHRVKIHPDKKAMAPVAVYEAGYLLWALNQGGRWYLASTETCQVQDWNNPGNQPPGLAVGNFGQRGGKPVFTPSASQPPPVLP